MATFTAVKCGTQSGGSMGRALNYVKKNGKTLWGDRQLVTGWNCVAKSAYDEMMLTKQRYDKTDGMMFYHFVQSFDPKEDVTPEEVHAIGLELAQKLFPEYEVVVATHTDAKHLHSHLIVNSVSFETGRKLHQNAADLQRQRQISDELCRAHGLTVLEAPPTHTKKRSMRPGEYRAGLRGESWKLNLIRAINEARERTAVVLSPVIGQPLFGIHSGGGIIERGDTYYCTARNLYQRDPRRIYERQARHRGKQDPRPDGGGTCGTAPRDRG